MLSACTPAANFRPPVNEPLTLHTGNEGQLSILTYNIQTVFGKDESKLDALLQYVNGAGFDFVLLQELFDEDARNYILEHADRNHYASIVSRVDYEGFPDNMFQDSGLFLMSKFPQVDLSGIKHDEDVTVSEGAVHLMLNKELSLSTDFLANKSVMGSLHRLDDSTHVFMFTTHLQALGSRGHKRSQYRQIRNFIAYATHTVLEAGLVRSPEDMIVLLTGDFNSDAYDEDDLDNLTTFLGGPRDLHGEYNPGAVEYTMMFKWFNLYKRFDYIFAYDEVMQMPMKQVRPQSVNVTDIKSGNNDSISDHLALKASLIIDQAAAVVSGDLKNSGRYAK
jgi:endonuclease/exonuclease/phosphatase family metal-dependent hydrolase